MQEHGQGQGHGQEHGQGKEHGQVQVLGNGNGSQQGRQRSVISCD